MQGIKNNVAGRSPVRRGQRPACVFAVLIGVLCLSAAAFSQEPPSPTLLDPNAGSNDSGLYPRSTNSTDRNAVQGIGSQNNSSQRETNDRQTSGSTTLSTNQIIAILHQKPEVIVDLKRVMADYFYKQGIAVQEDSITDEMLFSNIATHAALRQTVSVWLRARGYASDTDFDRSSEPSLDPEPLQPLSQTDRVRDLEEDNPAGMSPLAHSLRDLPADSALHPQTVPNPGTYRGQNPYPTSRDLGPRDDTTRDSKATNERSTDTTRQ